MASEPTQDVKVPPSPNTPQASASQKGTTLHHHHYKHYWIYGVLAFGICVVLWLHIFQRGQIQECIDELAVLKQSAFHSQTIFEENLKKIKSDLSKAQDSITTLSSAKTSLDPSLVNPIKEDLAKVQQKVDELEAKSASSTSSLKETEVEVLKKSLAWMLFEQMKTADLGEDLISFLKNQLSSKNQALLQNALIVKMDLAGFLKRVHEYLKSAATQSSLSTSQSDSKFFGFLEKIGIKFSVTPSKSAAPHEIGLARDALALDDLSRIEDLLNSYEEKSGSSQLALLKTEVKAYQDRQTILSELQHSLWSQEKKEPVA